MSPGIILAIDQGTSSTRCVAFSEDLTVLGSGSRPVKVSHPSPGWVEQDPEALLRSVVDSVHDAVYETGLDPGEVIGIGIANQTETFVVWDRNTGRPVYPAIVWQDRRSVERCAFLGKDQSLVDMVRVCTGLVLDSTFSATKISWVLDNVAGARNAAVNGDLLFGDVASWLMWKLSGGTSHVTDVSNASRTMLFGLASLDWEPELLEAFDVPGSMLPRVAASASSVKPLSVTDPSVLDVYVPVWAVMGDQQASLFGHRCWARGESKLTLGTGAFLWVNAGSSVPQPTRGALSTCAWQIDHDVTYALEGFVPAAGAVVSWLADVGLLKDPEDAHRILAGDMADASVSFVSALAGLGTPTWDSDTRGTIYGINRSTTAEDLVRAALDGVVHQVVDAIEALEAALQEPISEISVDGGMAANKSFISRLVNILGRPVAVKEQLELTSIGIASTAGLAARVWRSPDEIPPSKGAVSVEPDMDEDSRRATRERWEQAVSRARACRSRSSI